MRNFEMFAEKEESFCLKRTNLCRMVLEKVVNIDMNVGSEISIL